jgi:hypothetical protein
MSEKRHVMPDSEHPRRWQVIKLAERDYAAHGVLIQGPRCEDETLIPEAEVERLRKTLNDAADKIDRKIKRDGKATRLWLAPLADELRTAAREGGP